MRLILTRPEIQARQTTAMLRARGHQVVQAPMLTVQPLDPGRVELRDLQALAFTSANGVRIFVARCDLPELPLFCVGPATAHAANLSGFRTALSADGSGADLADLIQRRLRPDEGAILHPCADQLSFSLAAALAPVGFEVREVPFYRTVVADALPDAAVRALKERSVDGVLFFSLRAAEHFVTLTDMALLAPALSSITAFALSDQIAHSLRSVRWRTVRTAGRPDLGGMLDAVDQSLGL